MATKETYRERQENELAALLSIFIECVEDLRPPRKSEEDKWVPLDIRISLSPQKDSYIQEAHSKIKLRILCPRNYPKSPPKLSLEEPKNISSAHVSELLQKLNKEAFNLKGEEMIFDLCQTVQSFLHDHDAPPPLSFYDQMLLNKQQKDEEEKNQKKMKEFQTKQALEDEMQKRKDQLRKERKLRRTISESSPLHIGRTSNETENVSKSFSFNSQHCSEHSKSETLYCPTANRKIQIGCCIGHSQRGCINYSGIDLQNGQLCFITEWTVKISILQAQGKTVDDVVDELEKRVSHLSNLTHKNITAYECISCIKNKDYLSIYLVQEFILGTSVFNISATLGWSPEGASMVAKGVLEALIFLHNNGITHGNLMDSTVLLDNSGVIRVTDFSIVPYLQELSNGGEISGCSSDLPALGILVESLIPTPNLEMRDFIDKCKSERLLTSSELLVHPFLFPLPTDHSKTPDHNNVFQLQPLERALAERPQSNINLSQIAHFMPVISDKSRLQTEFEISSFIGKGAFGDVLKVRNKLDNRQYAIKRIPMSPRNKQLYRKMTREVELLSKLNHENVVRYFNSWIETGTGGLSQRSDSDSEGSSITNEIVKQSQSHRLTNTTSNIDKSDSEEDSDDWINFAPGGNDDDSDVVEFVNSRGEPVEAIDECSDDESDGIGNGHQKKIEFQYMYIQMEFCEKNTLRELIDNDLGHDKERCWKLFREIVEGLSHIHQQGMIHRDLKPVNIFLDSMDHVKIGDFGLATTSILALQSQEARTNKEQRSISFGNESMTTQVGTALYTAPEISENLSKIYSQKVDLYSLGIILFEMLSPRFDTAMERVKTIQDIRTPEIVIPEYLSKNDKQRNEVPVLKWLLSHDPNTRPTSAELLQSDLVPKSKMEASELQDMLRNVLANPQSRTYKHLISRCLEQESNLICDLTYHLGMVPISAVFENVKNKIVQILRKHGAIDISMPLLAPYIKSKSNDNTVRLMTHSGSVVTLPYDLRKPFLRHVALNGLNFLRRYSISRVYREKKMFDFHPKQLYECAFDIVTPYRGSNLVDAEVIAVGFEILSEFGFFKGNNAEIWINHTSLLRSIFMYCSVPQEKSKNLLTLINDFIERKLTKQQLSQAMDSILPSSKTNINLLLDLITLKCDVSSLQNSALRVLIKAKGEGNALANGALRDLQNVVNLANAMGVNAPIEVCLGLSTGLDCSQIGGVIWQIRGILNPEKSENKTLLACGGRYDHLLDEYQKSAKSSGLPIVSREMYSTGFSIAMDKLVFAITQSKDKDLKAVFKAVVDILVIVTGSRPPEKEVTQLLRSFWRAGLRCSVVEAQTFDDDRAENLGAHHIVLLGEGGLLRLKTWQQDHFFEQNVTKPEIIDYIKKNLGTEIIVSDPSSAEKPRGSCSSASCVSTHRNSTNQIEPLPSIEIVFNVQEKLTINKKKRLENQIEQKISGILKKFSKRELLTIFAVELMSAEIKALMSCIDPIPKKDLSDTQSELDLVLERFPKRKRYIQEVFEDVYERISENKANNVIGLFSISDSYYRLIL